MAESDLSWLDAVRFVLGLERFGLRLWVSGILPSDLGPQAGPRRIKPESL